MAFSISCSSDVFLKKKHARYYIALGKPHMLQTLCSSVRFKCPRFYTTPSDVIICSWLYIVISRYIAKSNFDVFFQDLSDFARHWKRHIFSVCFFFLLTITGGNEAIIGELKALFVLYCTFITFPGVPIIRFLAITKNGASSAFNSIFVATNDRRGKCNRHAVAPSDIFFTQVPLF